MSKIELLPALDCSGDIEAHKLRIEERLNYYLGEASLSHFPIRLSNAIRYVAMAPGKRLRPLLVTLTHEICGGRAEDVYPLACAVELIHAASLVHDDLPAMDDDAMRRDQPSLHEMGGEALAIIAGVTLVARAFEIASQSRARDLPGVVSSLAAAVGGNGMCGGQVMDLQAQSGNQPVLDDPRWLEGVFVRKTGSLMSAACKVGALAAGSDAATVDLFGIFGLKLGLAFQINDDVRDQDTDRRLNRPNYANAFGIDTATERLSVLRRELDEVLLSFGVDAARLRALAISALPNAGTV